MTKSNGKFCAGDYNINASDIGIYSNNEAGSAQLNLVACGSDGDGHVNISANGGTQIVSGDAILAVGTKSGGSATMDAGPSGKAVISSGSPVVPQTVTLDGESASIKIVNGALPVCPTIELTAESIRLSVGPTSFIEITAEGVTIEGLTLNLNGTVEANLSGAMANVKGEAMTGVTGGLITIG